MQVIYLTSTMVLFARIRLKGEVILHRMVVMIIQAFTRKPLEVG
jgi:hypothetical protein